MDFPFLPSPLERIRKQKARIRASGIDYLAYALLDCVVENYVFIVERLGEQIEDMEEEVLEKADPAFMAPILSIYPNSNLNTATSFFGACCLPSRW